MVHWAQLLEKIEVSAAGAPRSGTYKVVADKLLCRIEHTSGKTTDNQGVERERVQATIAMHYALATRFKVKTGMRLRHIDIDPVDYEIAAVREGAGLPRRWMILDCVRREKAAEIVE